QVDAEVAALGPAEVEVVGDDGEHGHGPKAVEGGHVRQCYRPISTTRAHITRTPPVHPPDLWDSTPSSTEWYLRSGRENREGLRPPLSRRRARRCRDRARRCHHRRTGRSARCVARSGASGYPPR